MSSSVQSIDLDFRSASSTENSKKLTAILKLADKSNTTKLMMWKRR